jgi:hypothetical protein
MDNLLRMVDDVIESGTARLVAIAVAVTLLLVAGMGDGARCADSSNPAACEAQREGNRDGW